MDPAAAATVMTMIGPSPAPNQTNHGPKVPSSTTEKQQNILRSDTKLTPWSSSGEFDSVGRGLLLATSLFPPPSSVSDDRCCPLTPEERLELVYAIHTAAVWRDRAEGGRLPHAVETSAALAGALLEDANAHDDDLGGAPRPSELSLRMLYSSAVVRATNGLADASIANRASKRPGYGVSVAALCEKLGIPGWIVDMRHDAAHNELPALPSLRLAAKTLLAYLGDRYWAELSRLRGDVIGRALGILDSYKASAKAAAVEESARVAAKIAKAEARKARIQQNKKNQKGDKGNDDDNGDESADQELWGFGQYSIFAEVDNAKKKKRSRAEPESNTCSATASSNANKSDMKPEIEPTIDSTDEKEEEKKMASPLHLAKEFVKEVPIGVGLQTLLSYLVWGGIGDMPPEKGALVPGSPATIPETSQGFDKVKGRYSLLLTIVASAWTGFLQALIVNLVDIVILLEERIRDGTEIMDAGDERKVFFLSSWIQYLLSREFQSYFDPYIGIFPEGNTDLTKKKVWRWTDAQRTYMSDCAPLEALQRWHFPLSSLFDRCNDSPANDANRKVAELVTVFERAAGTSLVKSMGLVDTQQPVEKQRVDATAEDARLSKRPKADVSMSLGQLEAMLSDSDADEKDTSVKSSDGRQGDGAKDEDTSSAAAQDAANKSSMGKNASAWVLCESWEPCAIGTLPGYPHISNFMQDTYYC